MPDIDTYSGMVCQESRKRSAPEMEKRGENLRQDSARVCDSSRPRDRSTRRRSSRHHSRSRRTRSSRSTAEGGRRYSSTNSSSSSNVCGNSTEQSTVFNSMDDDQTKLYDLFMDTKMEMMRIMDADMKLKMDVNTIKERFFGLIKNFEAFEQRNLEFDVSASASQLTSTRRQRHHISRSHITERRRKSIERRTRRYANELSSFRSSLASSQQCPNNTRVSELKTWDNSVEMGSNQYQIKENSKMLIDESAMSVQAVEDISSITRCSNTTVREQVSQSHIIDLAGPLSSTMSYPQYSTPEKQKRFDSISASRVEELDSTLLSSCSRKLDMDVPRPTPTGTDRIHSRLPNVVYNGTDSDATPVVVQRTRSVLAGSSLVSSNRSDDSTESKLRRQTAQPCLGKSNELRSPVGLSETDLVVEPPSFLLDNTVTDIQCSMNATRATVANISALDDTVESIPIDSDSGSDGNTPPSSINTVSTGIASSYKESDATNSSSPPRHHASLSKHRRSLGHHHLAFSKTNNGTSRRPLSQCTSATTSASSYGGFIAPSNSPNATNDSGMIKVSVRTQPTVTVEVEKIPETLGARPPCIGSDNGAKLLPLPPLPPNTRAMSDPETSVACINVVRSTRRRSIQHSGASSAGSTSDKSLSSLDSGRDNSSRGSGNLDVPSTPGKSASVRRSFSKKIMKLGKQLLRGSSSRTKSPSKSQHSV